LSVEIQNLNESERKINIEMPQEETQKYFEELLKKEAKKLTIPGFRKGKAPLSLVKKMYGEALFFDNLDKIAQNRFWDEMYAQGIDVFGVPKLTDLDLKDDKSLKFEIQFEVLPKIEINDLESIEVEKEEYEISEKFYDDLIDYIRFELRKEEPIEKVESMDCLVELEVSKTKDSNEEEKPTIYSVYLKSPKINQEFVNLLLNKNLNDEFESSIPVFKEESDEIKNIEGEKPNFKYKIKSIKRVTLPELNDELAKTYTNGKFETLEELKKEFAERELDYLNSQAKIDFREAIKNAFVTKYNFQPPSSLVENVTNYSIEQVKKKFNLKEPSNDIVQAVRERALNEARWQLIAIALKDKYNLRLSEEEINEIAQSLSEKFNIPMEEVIRFLYSRNSDLLKEMEEQKLFDFISEKIKIKLKKITI